MGLLASLFELAADVVDVVRERQKARATRDNAIREAWMKGYREGSGLEGGPGHGSRIGKEAREEFDRTFAESQKRDAELRARMRGDEPPKEG